MYASRKHFTESFSCVILEILDTRSHTLQHIQTGTHTQYYIYKQVLTYNTTYINRYSHTTPHI